VVHAVRIDESFAPVDILESNQLHMASSSTSACSLKGIASLGA
jgi:hypothetical protein